MKENIVLDRKKYPWEVKVRHHVSAQNYLPIEELQNIPDTYPPIIENINWQEHFKNGNQPNVLDIGCGKGLFLLSVAYHERNKNFLGIEVRKYPVEWINLVAKEEGLDNCSTINYTVANGLRFINENSIDRVYYLFPDPWPKSKHFRRRAFNPRFIEEVYRVLKFGGELFLATDCDYVDEYQLSLIAKFGKFSVRRAETNDWDLPLTNKERFCVEKEIKVYKCICTK